VDPELDEEARYRWLSQYVRTYLERDVRDLVALKDLEPFIRLQRYVSLQTGSILNYFGIAQQIGVSTKTVQRYIRYGVFFGLSGFSRSLPRIFWAEQLPLVLA